ncbi:MAG: pyridoxamine 5'-phosphate oxidase family protein [Hyphomicrobiaceae bacterium]|nr:pyridoxamine 5'-phosphate oxidase family protein [Hyphomicrobiaceae bacterium]
MTKHVSDVAFTSSVKEQQHKRGSRESYERMTAKRDWPKAVNENLQSFIAERDSFYLATASKTGQPYIQHRGEPKGFLRVLDEHTLAFADYAGNRQYISLGNLAENDQAHIFLMDYANRQRVKIWGRLTVVEGDAELLECVAPAGYTGRAERVFLFKISAWDVNCPKHIVARYDEATVREVNEKLAVRVAKLEAENTRLKNELSTAIERR